MAKLTAELSPALQKIANTGLTAPSAETVQKGLPVGYVDPYAVGATNGSATGTAEPVAQTPTPEKKRPQPSESGATEYVPTEEELRRKKEQAAQSGSFVATQPPSGDTGVPLAKSPKDLGAGTFWTDAVTPSGQARLDVSSTTFTTASLLAEQPLTHQRPADPVRQEPTITPAILPGTIPTRGAPIAWVAPVEVENRAGAKFGITLFDGVDHGTLMSLPSSKPRQSCCGAFNASAKNLEKQYADEPRENLDIDRRSAIYSACNVPIQSLNASKKRSRYLDCGLHPLLDETELASPEDRHLRLKQESDRLERETRFAVEMLLELSNQQQNEKL